MPDSTRVVSQATMNRTDRLYALVEELRARAPRPVRANELAARFEVSTRTIERDLQALQEAGEPIWAQPGPGGEYTLNEDILGLAASLAGKATITQPLEKRPFGQILGIADPAGATQYLVEFGTERPGREVE